MANRISNFLSGIMSYRYFIQCQQTVFNVGHILPRDETVISKVFMPQHRGLP